MSVEAIHRLSEKRKKWVEANRENNFEDGIKRLLADLYPDNAHFIYELLQNAEDAQATEVRFILQEDGVEFEHNGRLFSIEDVEAITGIGITTKKDDPTNIGKFGVGFKAVFAYTSTPEIASGKYHFRICDLVVPDTDGLAPCALEEKETRFTFPFDNPPKSPENACAEIEKNLRQLNEGTLLFLRNIRKIEYLLPDSPLGFLERRETDGNRIEIFVQHPEDSKPASVVFLRFEKKVDVDDEDGKSKACRIAVAFGMEKTQGQKWKVKLLDRGQVCIYFPAEKETSNLRFHLHAPFASTVARDSVREREANDELRDHLASLVAESMINIRDQGLLDVAFLATLPNNRDFLTSFYQPIQEKLVEVFQNEKLTPMRGGVHAAASGVYRGSARLSALISHRDLAKILGENYCPPMWIANPPQLNQREDNFLSLLEIPEWNEEDLVNVLSDQSEFMTNWMEAKSHEWHQKLYALLGDFLSNTSSNDWHIDELSSLSIVRLSDGTYEKGEHCYFPGDDVELDEDFPRVARGVYSSGKNKKQQKKARSFLEEIGVREVGEAERVEAILENRYSEAADKRGDFSPEINDIKRFIALVEKDSTQVELFENCFIFKLIHGKWGKPSQVYLDTPYLDTGLTAYYEALGEGLDHKWSLSPEYRECGIEPERLAEFAKAVGAQTKLQPKKQDIPSEHPEWNTLKGKDYGGWSQGYGIDEDYDIPEFDTLLAKPDLKICKLIWNTMNELPDNCLKAKYRSNSWYEIKIAYSTLVHRLKDAEWVPQKQKSDENKYVFLKPADAVTELLPDGFVFETGTEWLIAIEFGKVKQEREEQEDLKKQRRSSAFQHREEAARALDFESPEDAQEAKELLELKREDPEGFNAWKKRNKKPQFPEKVSRNSERRGEKVSQEHAGSPEKKYEKCMRSVRVTEATAYTRTWLKNQYTNEKDQMICQICKVEMPFKKRDGEYYFEAVEALSGKYFTKEHEAQFLALCPECAARYKEFIKRDEAAMKNLYQAMKNSNDLEVPLKLGELDTSIKFVETHRQDMKTILQLSQSDVTVVDRSDAWSEQDQKDLTTASLQYAVTRYPEEEDLV